MDKIPLEVSTDNKVFVVVVHPNMFTTLNMDQNTTSISIYDAKNKTIGSFMIH